jgi:hypothetical protein|tara:strand:- start:186 stop:401 length:216 start_codon:yes stop_codon:yes gene_type:complete
LTGRDDGKRFREERRVEIDWSDLLKAVAEHLKGPRTVVHLAERSGAVFRLNVRTVVGHLEDVHAHASNDFW